MSKYNFVQPHIAQIFKKRGKKLKLRNHTTINKSRHLKINHSKPNRQLYKREFVH